MKQVTAKNHSLLEACECQTKDIGSVSGDGSSMRNKFGDSEIFMLQNLVHQECRNGVITENKLRKIYGDIFPMGSAVKYVQLIFKSMDQNGKGFVRCTDFIEFLCVSARGSRLERASLCFRICDVSGRGAISRADLGRVLDSVAELVGCGSLGRADTVIDRIFARLQVQKADLIMKQQFLAYFTSSEMGGEAELMCGGPLMFYNSLL